MVAKRKHESYHDIIGRYLHLLPCFAGWRGIAGFLWRGMDDSATLRLSRMASYNSTLISPYPVATKAGKWMIMTEK
jgi:hypothetical protein